MTHRAVMLVLMLFSAIAVSAAGDGAWLARVPTGDHQRVNPYQGRPDAIAAGGNIFEIGRAHV